MSTIDIDAMAEFKLPEPMLLPTESPVACAGGNGFESLAPPLSSSCRPATYGSVSKSRIAGQPSSINELPRRKLRIAIVSGILSIALPWSFLREPNAEGMTPHGSSGRCGVFSPRVRKVDGVTRCLARLLAHLREQGHEAVVLGPQSGMTHYETHPLVGTAGIPLVLYPGLKLNFLRPRFLRVIGEFNPDVIHVVEPIWLGAQVLLAMQLGWAGPEWMPIPAQDRQAGVPRGPGGAVVASYHTNLPTYATLFGFPWLEPIMWRFVRWLHGKCLLTACPSQSTADMLRSRGVTNVRIWPRGVDLEMFGPHRRSAERRRKWGIVPLESCSSVPSKDLGLPDGVVPPLTPPPSPDLLPSNPDVAKIDSRRNEGEGLVVLYVGRISYEKNLLLLISAFELVLQRLQSNPSSSRSEPPPRLVFVGDGPARAHLKAVCGERGIDATFEGHLSGVELAEAYASADIFAFPSFTETFGQVVLEALASGLPVVGLDAEGTRDLVSHGRTGLLLRKSQICGHSGPSTCSCEWSTLLGAEAGKPSSTGFTANSDSLSSFALASQHYADLLTTLLTSPPLLSTFRTRALSEGIEGRTWHDAMEAMVDCYREGIVMAEERSGVRRTPTREKGARDWWGWGWEWFVGAGGAVVLAVGLVLVLV